MQISNAGMAHHEDYLDVKASRPARFDRLVQRFDWSKSTIKTLFDPLMEKGCLTRENSAKPLSTGFAEAGPGFRLGGWRM